MQLNNKHGTHCCVPTVTMLTPMCHVTLHVQGLSYFYFDTCTVQFYYFCKITNKSTITINPLNTKRRLLYLKTQFVPRSKHFSSRL